ncbi:hypothetical protein HMI54_009619 [Coelomomyces lativittatus]|nr:hypothetical protein HMI56_000343 [Coelomomyces lativittatus]KAJ1516403.1 hypothetical protein HMI54_009619 [Coelomomyces lativittatus]KAJ1516681.1 hypothetical protein HMI55_001670 [Coelomomyces lativittatus]
MLAKLLLLFSLCLLPFPLADAAKCAQYGDRCPEYLPFCNKGGYCTKDAIDAFLSQGCNPDASFSNSCVPDAQCKSFKEDFNDASSIVERKAYSGDPDKQAFYSDYDNFEISNGSVKLLMKYSPTLNMGLLTRLISTRIVHYGNFTARLKTSNGLGFVNSWIFKTSADSDTIGDEIDYEWTFGEDSKIAQTNYYVNGVIDYTKGVPAMMTGNSFDDFHTYTIVYEPNRLVWLVDDKVVRTVAKDTCIGNGTNACTFPNQQGRLFFSVWDTCGSPQGTVQWAQGPTKWCGTNAPAGSKDEVFTMTVDWVEVKCMPGYEEKSPPIIPKVQGTPTASSTKTGSNPSDSTPTFSSRSSFIYTFSFSFVIFIAFLFYI